MTILIIILILVVGVCIAGGVIGIIIASIGVTASYMETEVGYIADKDKHTLSLFKMAREQKQIRLDDARGRKVEADIKALKSRVSLINAQTEQREVAIEKNRTGTGAGFEMENSKHCDGTR